MTAHDSILKLKDRIARSMKGSLMSRGLRHSLVVVVSLILMGNGGFAFSDAEQNNSDRPPEGMVWIPGGWNNPRIK